MAKKKQKKHLRNISKTNKSAKKTKVAKMPIMPLGDRVLITELADAEMERTTATGIIIPDSADKDSGGKRGKVVAVGSGKIDDGKRVPITVSVGNTVLYQWGDKVKINDQEFVIVRESEIIAILNS
ncbi:MAG: co-chaperone GroES [bacterium]|nr:co-chaperone GroES [bacterium]